MIQLKNVSYSVDEDGRKKDIIKDISLTLDERFVAFTGPNGGGEIHAGKADCRDPYAHVGQYLFGR